MLKMYLTVVTVLCLTIVSATAIDYCGDLKCQKTPHIACNNPLAKGGWGMKCPSERMKINITPKLQQIMVDEHNKYRNQQALGQTPNYQPATRMATMKWDPELAKLAAINVRQCEMKHDSCRNTVKYAFAGQNLATSGSTGAPKSDEEELKSAIQRWFNEHTHGGTWGWMKIINEHQHLNTNKDNQVGHYTQVVLDQAHAVGCAASRWKAGKWNNILIACDYSKTNIIGAPIYVAGPTASECKTGKNPKYAGLCSESEKYE